MNRSDAETLWEVARVLARDAAKVSRARAPRALPPLLFFTDPIRTPRPWETAARLPAGAAVVFRHFGQADALGAALRLRDVTARAGVRLLIGLDADLAEAVGADGLHLPERALDQAGPLSEAHPEWLITGAAHAGSPLDSAHLHARILSPLFAAGGASSARAPLDLTVFRTLAASAACPVYALGGIDAKNAQSLIGSGAGGLAGVSAIQAAFGA
ncbi:MAG: thiamine phosphate synthase [Brevundimonas sp.]|uniref:thiamine phosphate synthase n=1 Tax=Brevundimonas sp. TaxID=1871086 RepID=UPI00248858D6|nr:thiamine phosphate synthase [Brevundimonas sp.]MDI1328055.1 thiamine phosphate synthase [Brevundimonas sp.]